jgi:bifunctional UDP-N-acetylglucosamine pyrophosphorylase/glucosamine-1-phosphate N-acetyltransferase
MSNDHQSESPSLADTAEKLQALLAGRLAAAARLVEAGVTIVDPLATYIEAGVRIGAGTVIQPNTTLSGSTSIGENCRIGPNTIVVSSKIANRCSILASVVEDSEMEERAEIGPYCHLRGGTRLESGVHLGNFVEVKGSRVGRNSKAGHFSYIGDADIGEGVNIGAGTVTCNYDGEKKHQTVIEDGVFVGSDTMLVAPVRLGKGSATGAGSVVTRDVPAGGKVAGVPAKPIEGSDGR